MKKKSTLIFLLPFIITITSCFIISQIDKNNYYNSLQDTPTNDTNFSDDFFKSNEYQNDLVEFSYLLYYDAYADSTKSIPENISMIFGINQEETNVPAIQEFLQSNRSVMNEYYSYLSFYVKSGDLEISNIDNDPLQMTTENATNSYLKLVSISFDENGDITSNTNIPFQRSFKSINMTLIRNRFTAYDSEREITITPIKNTTFYFGINKNVDLENITYPYYYDNIHNYPASLNYYNYSEHIDAILMSFVIAAIIALILPIKRLREFELYRSLFSIPIEITAIVSFLFLLGTYNVIINHLFYTSFGSMILYGLLLFIFILDVLVFKDFLRYPPMQYLKDKSFIGNGFSFIIKNIRQFDLSDSYNHTLIKIILINALAIFILPMLFGGTGLIIYCVILFIILINIANQVRNDYRSLLDVTSSIASGNFDKSIKTDLGIFNSYKDSMDMIKEDFQEAISNEIKSEKMKSELITSVSHDLKTPLTSIVTYADLLKDEHIDMDKKREYIEVIDRNAIRLKNLINDLFEVSKASSGNVSLDLMDIDVISLIKQTLYEYDEAFNEKGLMIKFNPQQEKIMLYLDGQKTYRIFTNLFTNIKKYALENTRVYIDIKDSELATTITLRNISKHEIQVKADDLLERFVQGDSSRHSEGSGLGLAIAKTFSELQGGQCDVDVDGDLFKVVIRFNKK